METYDRTLDSTRKYLSPDHDVLEVGYGTGATALRLASSVKRIVATDIAYCAKPQPSQFNGNFGQLRALAVSLDRPILARPDRASVVR
jgi:hypothetical protein